MIRHLIWWVRELRRRHRRLRQEYHDIIVCHGAPEPEHRHFWLRTVR
jgi:hypothetical protein